MSEGVQGSLRFSVLRGVQLFEVLDANCLLYHKSMSSTEPSHLEVLQNVACYQIKIKDIKFGSVMQAKVAMRGLMH